jgi:hypothetical protein
MVTATWSELYGQQQGDGLQFPSETSCSTAASTIAHSGDMVSRGSWVVAKDIHVSTAQHVS